MKINLVSGEWRITRLSLQGITETISSGLPRSFQSLAMTLCVTFYSLLSTACLYAEIPQKPIGYISDFANILDDNTESELNSLVTQVEQKTSAEIAVVTVSSLDGMSVEDYANELFNKWGIGKKCKDNGVLVLVALNERKMRIEVGYGLEPVLPDGKCGEIRDKYILPYFRQNNYSEGIIQGTSAIAKILGLENVETRPGPPSYLEKAGAIGILGWMVLAFLLTSGIKDKVIGTLILFICFAFVVLKLNIEFWKCLDISVAGISVKFFYIVYVFLTSLIGYYMGKSDHIGMEKKKHWTFFVQKRRRIGDGLGGFSSGSGGGGFGGGSSGGGGASGGW
ncbi:MAG: TPM domain-containing protein [Elusimicrobiota bacterium]